MKFFYIPESDEYGKHNNTFTVISVNIPMRFSFLARSADSCGKEKNQVIFPADFPDRQLRMIGCLCLRSIMTMIFILLLDNFSTFNISYLQSILRSSNN